MAQCPKCQAAAKDGALECAACGIVFAKFYEHAEMASVRTRVAPATRAEPPPTTIVRVVRAGGLAAMAAWTIHFARLGVSEALDGSVLHLPDLVFHEAGHVIFAFMGRFMTVLGGSLFQFLVPVILSIAFVRQRNFYGAVVCAWWAGQSLVDVSPYIADARALQLVLIGGHTGAEVEGHDWEFILTQLGWLHLDTRLGLAAFRIGLALMIAAIAWGAVIVVRNRPDQHLDNLHIDM
jgi:hypothetical protein